MADFRIDMDPPAEYEVTVPADPSERFQVSYEPPPTEERFRVDLAEPQAAEIGIKKVPQAVVSLEARKTMNGDFLILDHVDMDIVIAPKENKVVTFPKERLDDYVYDSQSRLFHHLSRRGIGVRDSVRGGNVYGALEGTLSEAQNEAVDPVEMAIFSISRFIDKERPHFEFVRQYDDYIDNNLTDPPPDESTPLGKIPEEPRKGSIVPNMRPYNLMYKMYEQKGK